MTAPTLIDRNLLWPAAWSLDAYEAVKDMQAFFPDARLTRYPLRFLRYWFVRHLIEHHARQLQRPVDVLEVGVDRGQMLVFMGGQGAAQRPACVHRWDAVDVAADPQGLFDKGYTGYTAFDLEQGTPPIDKQYDVIIFLHLLEHLHAPEDCLRSFMPHLRNDGLIVGGSPTMPKLVADLGYERRLKRRAKPFGHVSIISPERIELFAEAEQLQVRFMSGGFLMRASGHWVENSALWLKLNVAFGALFPSIASEVNFCLSR